MAMQCLLIGYSAKLDVTQGARTWMMDRRHHSFAGFPAVQWYDNWREWHKHNKLHRAGGLPAVIRDNGSEVYFIHGRQVTPDQAMAYKDYDE